MGRIVETTHSSCEFSGTLVFSAENRLPENDAHFDRELHNRQEENLSSFLVDLLEEACGDECTSSEYADLTWDGRGVSTIST